MKNAKHLCRRGLALLLALMMCAGMLSVTASATPIVTLPMEQGLFVMPSPGAETPGTPEEPSDSQDVPPLAPEETPEEAEAEVIPETETPETPAETPEETTNESDADKPTVLPMLPVGAPVISVDQIPAKQNSGGIRTLQANSEIATLAINDDSVASVDGTGYATLAEAIDAAGPNQTVILEKSFTLTGTLVVTKTATLDLNGKTVNLGSSYLSVNSGNFTITDSDSEGKGKIAGTGGKAIEGSGNSHLTISGGTISAYSYGVALFDSAELDVKTNENGTEPKIYALTPVGTNGSYSQNARLNISGGELISFVINRSTGEVIQKNDGACGIYLPAGTLTVSGTAYIEGTAGIVVRGGNLTVEGGRIVANGLLDGVGVGDVKHNNKMVLIPAAGIAIDKHSGYSNGNVSVTITGGTVLGAEGEHPASAVNYTVFVDDEEHFGVCDGLPLLKDASENEISAVAGTKISVTGGIYSDLESVQKFVPAGNQLLSDGTLTISDTAVASINGFGYASLQKAIDAAQTGDIVMLEQNILNQPTTRFRSADTKFALDLMGHSITLKGCNSFNIGAKGPVPGVDVTIQDSVGDGMITMNTDDQKQYGILTVQYGAKLTVKDGVTIKSTGAVKGTKNGEDVTYGGVGITMWDTGSTLVVENANVSSETGYAISTNGSGTQKGSILIQNGSFTSDTGVAMYLASAGCNVEITGGFISGQPNGVVVRGSSIKINGDPTITATANSSIVVGDSGNGKVPPAALVVDSDSDYNNGVTTAEITGGTFIAEEGDVAVIYTVENTPSYDDPNLAISGGSFSSPVEESYLDDSLKVELKGTTDEGQELYSYHKGAAEAVEAAQEAEYSEVEIRDLEAEDDSEDAKQLTITFNPGEDATVSPTQITVTAKADSTIGSLIGTLPTPTRSGYNFAGWYTTADDGTQYTADTVVELGEDETATIEMFAHWTAIPATTTTPSTGGSRGGGGSTGGNVNIVEEDVPLTELPFTFIDIADGDWFYGAVKYVFTAGLMQGVGDDEFAPGSTTTRAMLMTILARMDGVDTTGGSSWYEKAMEWAVENGVSDGSNPEGAITREQLATMLWRYLGEPEASGDAVSAFPDASSVSDWAKDAMLWAVENGIINGSDGMLNPQTGATRAEMATMLMRFCEKYTTVV